MRPWMVLPVKSIAHGKSRLAPHLCSTRRGELNLQLFERSLALAGHYPGLDHTLVVSGCPDVLALASINGAGSLREQRTGLNEAVEQALAHLSGQRGDPILIVSCDLPFARAEDLRALVRPGEIVLATDRAGSGTNALCLPAGQSFSFQYGPASRDRHVKEAERRGLRWRVLQLASLAFDLDTLDDYQEWRRQQQGCAGAF